VTTTTYGRQRTGRCSVDRDIVRQGLKELTKFYLLEYAKRNYIRVDSN